MQADLVQREPRSPLLGVVEDNLGEAFDDHPSTGLRRLVLKAMWNLRNGIPFGRGLLESFSWVLVLIGLACSAPAADETRHAENSEEAVIEESSQYDPGLEPFVVMAKEDLAERLEVGVEIIEVVEAELVVWPDASMGCPDPDMMYIQVPQDGSRIRLQVEEAVFEYHAGGERMPFLCEDPAAPVSPPQQSDAASD